MRGVAETRTDFKARAIASWGTPPDWVLALADEAQRTTGAKAASRVGYSASTISQVLSNTYRGDIRRVEEMVSGALMKAVVDCPVLGRIGRDRCLHEQVEPFRATSAMRAQLWHACRGGCPHSKHTPHSGHTKGEPSDV